MKNKYWVYKITSPSGKIYIGITSNIIKRFCFYKNHSCENQTIIYNSIVKYGWDNHIKEILFISLTKEEAFKKEIELIEYYKTNKTSLNISNGGLTGHGLSIDENPLSKKTLQFTKEGEFIKEWDSLNSIEYSLKFSATNIGKVCRNKTFWQHGYLWCFKEDYNNGIVPVYIDIIGKGNSKSILKYNNQMKLVKEYFSVSEAIREYKGINPKRNIYSSLKYNSIDGLGNYWKYKKL